MEKRQQDKLNTLAGIVSFLDDHAIEIGKPSASPARVELEGLVKNLTLQGRAQAAAAGELRLHALRRRALRRELYARHLRPLAAIVHAELADTSLAAALRCLNRGARSDLLLEAVEAIGTQAVKYRHVFVRHGLGRDFVTQLRAVVDAMDRQADQRAACVTRLKAATASLASGLRRAVRLVSVLGALVEAQARGNPALIAAWVGVRRGEVSSPRHSLEVSRVA
jgi:hypothetical protein